MRFPALTQGTESKPSGMTMDRPVVPLLVTTQLLHKTPIQWTKPASPFPRRTAVMAALGTVKRDIRTLERGNISSRSWFLLDTYNFIKEPKATRAVDVHAGRVGYVQRCSIRRGVGSPESFGSRSIPSKGLYEAIIVVLNKRPHPHVLEIDYIPMPATVPFRVRPPAGRRGRCSTAARGRQKPAPERFSRLRLQKGAQASGYFICSECCFSLTQTCLGLWGERPSRRFLQDAKVYMQTTARWARASTTHTSKYTA